ncbi:hypothetical protein QOT17_012759 [Balamuthia mandrillaris]
MNMKNMKNNNKSNNLNRDATSSSREQTAYRSNIHGARFGRGGGGERKMPPTQLAVNVPSLPLAACARMASRKSKEREAVKLQERNNSKAQKRGATSSLVFSSSGFCQVVNWVRLLK